MTSPEDIKLVVRQKYAEIASQHADQNRSSCCGVGSSCGDGPYTIMSDDYSTIDGYVPDADLGLGCGIPTEYARIVPGMTVLDLGSGAGNDAFIALQGVGGSGRVIGVDMTPEMIEKAERNRRALGVENVEFRLGDIEALPVGDGEIDVVLSNCVLNLVPDKRNAYAEMLRVLRRGGRFAVSDIVLEGQLPDGMRQVAELYAGCVAGALQKDEYLEIIESAGFADVRVEKEKEIVIPEALLAELVDALPEDQRSMGGARVLSITVTGSRP